MTKRVSIYSLVLVFIGALYALMIKPHIAGFEYDDGAYLIAAKALASGHGYSLPFTPGNPALVKYPPLTSVVMAPLWWLWPAFPANIILFKGLDVVFMLAFLGLFAFYCDRHAKLPPWQTACLLLLSGLNPGMAHCATEILSEPIYLVLSMAVILLAAKNNFSPKTLVTMLMLAVLAFYARTIGVLLVAALGLYVFLAHHKKTGLIMFITGLALSSGWFFWTHAQPDFTQAFTYNHHHWAWRTLNESYLTSIKTDLLYHYTPFSLYQSGVATLYSGLILNFWPLLSLIPHAVAIPLNLLLGLVMAAWLVLSLIRNARLKHYTLPGIYVALYFLVLPGWAYHDQYDRFIAILTPFLWLWFFQSIGRLEKTQLQKTLLVLLTLVALAGSLLPIGFRLTFDRGDSITLDASHPFWSDFVATTQFINTRTQPGDVLWVSHLDLPYALYTNRFYYEQYLQLTDAHPENITTSELPALQNDQAALMRARLIMQNTRYVVSNPVLESGHITAPVTGEAKLLLSHYPQELHPVYVSPHGLITVYAFRPQS